jgi:hypothetical protein
MAVWPHFPLRACDVFDDDIAKVNTNFIAQIDVFVVSWFGGPLVQALV